MNCPNCRAALPPGSRFCNRCGVTLTPAQPAPQERTQAYNPGTGQFGQPTQYGQPAPAYVPPPVPAEPARKPVWLLALILALVAGGVTAGTLFLVKGKHSAVVSNESPLVPTGSGVTQTGQPGQPAGPAVVSSQPGKPAPEGAPVTSAPGKPGSDMAPSVMMTDPGKPGSAPSVVQAPTGPATPGMPVQAAPAQPARPGPALTQGQPQTPKPGQMVQAQPTPPPPDNSDFDRYLKWLRYVEDERHNLRAMGETQSFRVMEGYLHAVLGLADPDTNENQAAAQMQASAQRMIAETRRAIQLFQYNMRRTKPPVPSDCVALDRYYCSAAVAEAQATEAVVYAMSRNDIGTIKRIGRSAVTEIDMNLGQANRELERVYQRRGLNPLFKIDAGGGSSMLDGLGGLGGLR